MSREADMRIKKMMQKNDLRAVEIGLLSKIVDSFCDLCGILESQRSDVLELELKHRGAYVAVLFAVEELKDREIDVKHVCWDEHKGLLIKLADSKLDAESIDKEIKQIIKRRNGQDQGWFIVSS
jgi:hypothetical protein